MEDGGGPWERSLEEGRGRGGNRKWVTWKTHKRNTETNTKSKEADTDYVYIFGRKKSTVIA